MNIWVLLSNFTLLLGTMLFRLLWYFRLLCGIFGYFCGPVTVDWYLLKYYSPSHSIGSSGTPRLIQMRPCTILLGQRYSVHLALFKNDANVETRPR